MRKRNDHTERILRIKSRGYGVRVLHVRESEVLHPGRMDGGLRRTSATGGQTRVVVTDPEVTYRGVNAPIVAEGVALCHPGENYAKRLGLAVALGRAEAALRIFEGYAERRSFERREDETEQQCADRERLYGLTVLTPIPGAKFPARLAPPHETHAEGLAG